LTEKNGGGGGGGRSLEKGEEGKEERNKRVEKSALEEWSRDYTKFEVEDKMKEEKKKGRGQYPH